MPYDGDRSDNKKVLPDGWRGSTALNSTIKSYEDLAYRVKTQLGFPVVELEISDEQVAIFIDEALEWFTQYAGRERRWIVFTDQLYEEGCGVKLDDIVRNVSMRSECFKTLSSTVVTGTDVSYSPIPSNLIGNTHSAYLSVSPFSIPSTTDPSLSSIGQRLILKYDKNNPWDAGNVCNANCFTLKPIGSDCYSLTANPNLETINISALLDEYPNISYILDHPTISADDDGILSLSSLPCDVLSAIPIDWFPLSAFYPPTELIGFPVTACVEIANGFGAIYPSCDKSKIICNNLTASWTIDPDFDWSPFSGGTLSGEDGRIISYEDLNLIGANSVTLPGLPTCTIDGVIPLFENTGYYSTFYICNSAIDTGGKWEIENVQFKKSFLPPSGALNKRFCDLENKGFTIVKTITSHGDCVQPTGRWVPVDVVFESQTLTNQTGVVVTSAAGGFDPDLNYRRKVIDAFSIDYTMGNGGYFGSNLLFSFDYGVVANAFGFDLQGNRNLYRNGYDMLSYELARGFIDRVRRMVNYVTYEFNSDTQYLRLIPEPFPETRRSNGAQRAYVVGVYVEKPLAHLINKKWVQEWVKARIMESVGHIRAKFGTVTLFGGASIQGDSLVSMAQSEMERLLRELRDDLYYTEPPFFFVG